MDKVNVFTWQWLDKVKVLYTQSNGFKLNTEQENQLWTLGGVNKASSLTRENMNWFESMSKGGDLMSRKTVKSEDDEIVSQTVSVGGAIIHEKSKRFDTASQASWNSRMFKAKQIYKSVDKIQSIPEVYNEESFDIPKQNSWIK